MNSGYVPRLVMSETLKQSVDEYGIQAWITLFSLLFDPEVDGGYKRRHASDMIMFTDERLLFVAYRVVANGDLHIGFIHDESDMDRM